MTWEAVDLSQALVVLGFPSVGLVGSIASAHLVASLRLREVGALISPEFPPTAVVREGISTSPVRVYLGDVVCGVDGGCQQLCVIHSDVAPKSRFVVPLADAIVSWARARGARGLVGLEGVTKEDAREEEVGVLGIASDPEGRRLLDGLHIPPLEDGVLTGIGGVALYAARVHGVPALCLLAESREDFPDARGAARLLETLQPLVPLVPIDERPLYEQAELLEAEFRRQLERSQRAVSDLSQRANVMYG
ncbi:MAG: proteasome assembly chaperone family protein [Euryarchaeota archaeon]|nr:proteasome assembly chaperone family protein [Euryarchaeota archaeon]